MGNSVRALKVLFKYLFEGVWIYDALLRSKKVREGNYWYDPVSKNLLKDIRSFYDTQFIQLSGTDYFQGNLLIESLYEQSGSNYNNFLLGKLIHHNSKSPQRQFVLVNNEQDPSIEFWKGLGSYEFVYLNRWISLASRFTQIGPALLGYFLSDYTIENGIALKWDHKNVGDLIYDDLLRKTNFPTYRRKGLLLFAAIYFARLKYCAYKKIYRELEIGHIVSTHDVYINWGLLFKACNEKVKCWTWFGHEMFSLTQSSANWDYILKPCVVTQVILTSVLEKGPEWIETQFSELVAEEFGGKMLRTYDDLTVYRDIEVTDKKTLIDLYGKSIDPKKKNIFVMAHAFVDGVNKAHWRLFSDYYTWLEETLSELAQNSNINIFVKPHPSEIYYQCSVTVKDVVDQVNLKYGSKVIFLDKKISNWFVLTEFADVFVTARGSISGQAPCFGKPVLVAGSVFTETAKAVIQPKSIVDYIEHLKNIHTLAPLEKDVVFRAKAAYLFLQKFCFSKTRLNAFKTPLWKRDEELTAVFKNLSLFDSIKEISVDPLVIDFNGCFISKSVRQTVSHKLNNEKSL